MRINTSNNKGTRHRLFVLWVCAMLSLSLIFVSLQQQTQRATTSNSDMPVPDGQWSQAIVEVVEDAAIHEKEVIASDETQKTESRVVESVTRLEIQSLEKEKEKLKQNIIKKKKVPELPREEPPREGVPRKEQVQRKNKVVKKVAELKTKLKKSRPPLNTLITDADRGITGHVSFLLDWAILGHAKTGTSFIMKWLNKHPEIATWEYEVCDLYDNRPAGLVKRLYEELPEGKYKRGFKCPGHFSRRSIRYFKRYFSKTNVIVGVRHPVRWFESFYNFRMRHGGANYSLPHPNKLIGECTPEKDGVCTDRANFHTNLAVFGKTNLMDPAEQSLIRFRKYTYESTYRIDNPLFLYDVDQFKDPNSTRIELFKKDLQRFLGLKVPLPEPSEKDAGKSSRPKPKAIDICSDEFNELRSELLQVGKRASTWIRKYFLKSDQVYVSSRDQFEEIIKKWEDDPCDEENVATA